MRQTYHENGETEELLLEDMPWTAGYKPSLPVFQFYSTEGVPQLYALRDVEFMLTHPHVSSCMEVFKSGIFGAEFEIKAEENIGHFVLDQCNHFWQVGMPLIQGGYDYGWIGAENMYCQDEDDGLMKWDRLIDFAPRDTTVLTLANEYCGVRVTGVQGKGKVDLPAETIDVPSKAFWYAHQPRYQRWYGASQYSSAWRPWKRLATMDAAECIVDLAIYRHGVPGPVFKYPPESYRKIQGTQGWQNARDMARQFIEQAKAGAGVALPSGMYPKEQGGGPKWSMEWPTSTMNVDGILAYIEYLKKEIAYGIGTPPEILEASETGSGYSGRAIPLEAFLMRQQRLANRILDAFVKQVLKPLVKYNFGLQAKFEVKVKDLLQTRMERATKWSQPQQQPGQGAMPGQPGQQQPGMPGQDQQQQQMPGQNPAAMAQPAAFKQPYIGPRGGRGFKDAQGHVHYANLSHMQDNLVKLCKLPRSERMKAGRPGMKLLGLAVADELGHRADWGSIRRAIVDAARRVA